jgi:uncharacterized protein YjdB
MIRSPCALVPLLTLLVCCSDPAKIDVQPQPLILKSKGETRRLDISVLDSSGKSLDAAELTFTALTPEVVSVDRQGAVVARRSGDGKILVSAGKVSATAVVSVRIPARIELDPRNPVLNVGVSQDIRATIIDDAGEPMVSAEPIRWSVSDSSIVALSGQGTIKTLKEGRATVTAFIGDVREKTVITVRHEKYDDETGTWSQ